MEQNGQVEQLKSKGNDAFSKKDYNTAIKCYSEALVLDPKNFTLFSNRCSAYFALEKFREALNDAKQSISINPEFSKGHYKLGMAYSALNQPKDAAKAFNKALSFDPNADNISQYEKNQRSYIDRYFQSKTKGQPVEVKYISINKGKGVFATRNFKEGEVIMNEDPISSHRVLNKNMAIKCCSFCMRSFLSQDNLGSQGAKYWKDIYNGTKPEWIYCEYCKEDELCEYYCSKSCKQKAWSSYHQLLCLGYDYKTKQKVNNTPGHQSFKELYKLCSEQNKSHPLFIVRMLAIVLSQMIFNQKSFDDAWEPFSLFVSGTDPCFGEELAIKTLMDIVKDEKYATAANVNNYRHLHWAIVKNAQSLNPVSDFHLYMNSLPESAQFQIVKALGSDLTPYEFLQTDYMNTLSAWGNGLFAIANSMNHSCAPNIATASANNSNKITFLAIRSIKKGEEMSISYIDETKPFAERNKLLNDAYSFVCQCEKCIKRI